MVGGSCYQEFVLYRITAARGSWRLQVESLVREGCWCEADGAAALSWAGADWSSFDEAECFQFLFCAVPDLRGEAGAFVGFGEPSPPEAVGTVTEKERALLSDIATHPIAGVTARYERLGWNAKIGNAVKDAIITSGLAEFENVPTANARIKILTLTDDGIAYLTSEGITVPSWRWGGAAHEYWRETIRQLLERHGYTVTNEYAVQGGYVDLHATKGDHELFVEIETGKSDTNANTEKCKALDGTVVFFFVTELLREEQRDAFAALPTGLLLTPHDLDRLHDSL